MVRGRAGLRDVCKSFGNSLLIGCLSVFGTHPLQEELLGHITLPAIGAAQHVNECVAGQLGQSGQRSRWSVDFGNAVDPATVMPCTQLESLDHLSRHVFRMFDHHAIHIDDPDGTIGTGSHHRGAEPWVHGREKLALRFARWTFRLERDSVTNQMATCYQVVRRLANKVLSRDFIA